MKVFETHLVSVEPHSLGNLKLQLLSKPPGETPGTTRGRGHLQGFRASDLQSWDDIINCMKKTASQISVLGGSLHKGCCTDCVIPWNLLRFS